MPRGRSQGERHGTSVPAFVKVHVISSSLGQSLLCPLPTEGRMYFAVMKLTFETGGEGMNDARDLKALAEKIRRRFHVAAQPGAAKELQGILTLGVAALGGDQAKLSQKLDGIIDFCEESGFGRVESETTLLDHLDNLDELGDEEPDD